MKAGIKIEFRNETKSSALTATGVQDHCTVIFNIVIICLKVLNTSVLKISYMHL